MSKMACHCGNLISDSIVPCPTEGYILRDQEIEQYHSAVCRDVADFFAADRAGRREAWIRNYFLPQYPANTANEEVINDIITRHATNIKLSVAECGQCGRLWVQRRNGENVYLAHAPDDPGYKGVLRSDTLGGM